MLKSEILWPTHRQYKSDTDWEPIGFFSDCLCNSTHFDLLLGFFSSSAIEILSNSFALFLHKGGRMRLIINNILSKEDKQLITNGSNKDSDVPFDLSDLSRLKHTLSKRDKHFFECLAWLIYNKRIEIKIIAPKSSIGISHTKQGVFRDDEQRVSFNGSCNFSKTALVYNIESIDVSCEWDGNISKAKVDNTIQTFNRTFSEQDTSVFYLDPEQLETNILSEFGDKSMHDLLQQELDIIEESSNANLRPTVKNIIKQSSVLLDKAIQEQEEKDDVPRFPYETGPRKYQKQAYDNWIDNDYKGLFAMATGTGKTLTSLNCILQEYTKNQYYKFLVLVPTTALAKQWIEETNKKFNYQNTILCCSENANWREELTQIGKSILLKRPINYGIITTYASFKGIKFQTILKDYFQTDFDKITLIADEAHNFGSPGFLKVIPNYISRRIGLSATPERQFDDEGNRTLNEYFSCSEEEYTFEYNMKTAIENEVLCRYYYYPVIVNLEIEEQTRYLEISKELVKYIDSTTGKYRESDYVNMLLLKRKSIIHKATNKLNSLLSIINKIGKENFKRAFIYVPEGIELDYLENENIPFNVEDETSILIDIYIEKIYDKFQLKMAKFTGETKDRDKILLHFKQDKLDALLAMKCLDEGVDVPQTQYAIFCSSTGNPRQYIQRRGRVLRMHKNKKHAIIFDLIVKPTIDHTNTNESLTKMEKNIFFSELKRLVNFAVLSENKDESLAGLESLCYDLNIDIYELANNELNNYK